MTQDKIAPGPQQPDATNQPSCASLIEKTTKDKLLIALQSLSEKHDSLDEEIELKELSKEFGIGVKPLRERLHNIKTLRLRGEINDAGAPTPEELEIERERDKEKKLAGQEAARQQQERQNEIQRRVDRLKNMDDLKPEFHKKLTRAGYQCGAEFASTLLLIHGCRLLTKTIAIMIYGESGSGKSDGVERAAEFLPEDKVQRITAMSDKALPRMGDLAHKQLTLGEFLPKAKGQDDPVQQFLRQFVSEGELIYWCNTPAPKGGGWVLAEIKVKGPCTLIATTSLPPSKYDSQWQNRCVWMGSDAGEGLTEKVLDAIADGAAMPVKADDESFKLDIESWRQFHSALKPLTVKIPFSKLIKPIGRHVSVRRLFHLILNYTRAHAILHQHRREHDDVNGQQIIIATPADYAAAYAVLVASAPKVLQSSCPAALNAFNEILKPEFEKSGNSKHNTPAIKSLLKKDTSVVYEWLRDWVRDGLLTVSNEPGSRGNLYQLSGQAKDFKEQDLGLVSPDLLDWRLIGLE